MAAVSAILIAGAARYLTLLHYFRVYETPSEEQFGAPESEAAVRIYIEPISVDARNHSMHVHVNLVASGALRDRLGTAPNRDLFLVLTHGKTAREIKFAADEPIAAAAFDLGPPRPPPMTGNMSACGVSSVGAISEVIALARG